MEINKSIHLHVSTTATIVEASLRMISVQILADKHRKLAIEGSFQSGQEQLLQLPYAEKVVADPAEPLAT